MDFKVLIDCLKEFHETFYLDIHQKKNVLNDKVVHLRHSLMEEENDEYLEAALNEDIVGIADALGDQLYVLVGTIVAHGLQDKIEEVFFEIHRSNMTKTDEKGKPIYNWQGKVVKGPNYQPPNIKKILEG